jgi:NlpC/P60 family putative phage cell wall peptidase
MGIEEPTLPLREGRNVDAKRRHFGEGSNAVPDPSPNNLAALNCSTLPQGEGRQYPQGGGNDIVHIARSWIGTPYVHQASVKGAGCDCLGLLRGVWRELHGDEPEDAPPYSPDWAEASGEETLYRALGRHLGEIAKADIGPGDIALFRMARHGPSKHCGIIALDRGSQSGGSDSASRMTLIHARQNKRVSEEPFSPFWRHKLAFAFRL